MKKLLNGFGALYRYPTLAVMLVVILLFCLRHAPFSRLECREEHLGQGS